jgi:hypothetical protein
MTDAWTKRIDQDKITAVLLPDEWHYVETTDSGTGTFDVTGESFTFKCQGQLFAGPTSSILAVRI